MGGAWGQYILGCVGGRRRCVGEDKYVYGKGDDSFRENQICLEFAEVHTMPLSSRNKQLGHILHGHYFVNCPCNPWTADGTSVLELGPSHVRPGVHQCAVSDTYGDDISSLVLCNSGE